jgi:hypothetical protein
LAVAANIYVGMGSGFNGSNYQLNVVFAGIEADVSNGGIKHGWAA